MNNKGQSLVLFVLILPIIIAFLAFFVDITLVTYRKSQMTGVLESNLKVILDKEIKDDEKINQVFIENNVDCDDISINDDDITIKIDTKLKSLFGKILKIDFYRLKVTYRGNYIEKKIDKIG